MADRSNELQHIANDCEIELCDIPLVPDIDDAIETALAANGVLDMESWHGPDDLWCGATHCRAGWAIHLAGKDGVALEDRVGPLTAGMLIYLASRPDQRAPDFFASNQDALTDIRKCAAEQRAARG